MDALKLRKKLKSKKPKFFMTGIGERPRVKRKWRLARGSDNKIRQNLKGYPKRVKIGFGSPGPAKGLHPSGLNMVMVYNEKDIEGIDKKIQGACISGKIGDRKRLAVIKKCQEKEIKVLNIKAEDYIKKVSEAINAKKEEKKKKAEEKDKKKKEKEKKAAEKDKKEEKAEESKGDDLSEKVEQEKDKLEQEKQKVLTMKE
jgi:large subunit ribosomal protein L32e